MADSLAPVSELPMSMSERPCTAARPSPITRRTANPAITTAKAPTTLRESVGKAWKVAKLTALGFHEARHTAASLFIASGMNAKTVTTLLGHSSIAITFDRYGHLFPGAEHEARDLLDAYLDGDED